MPTHDQVPSGCQWNQQDRHLFRGTPLTEGLTLLTRISVASKCLPYILGDSPGIGSIFTQTSCPFFATSTCLWFISILVTIPMSTNCKIRTKQCKQRNPARDRHPRAENWGKPVWAFGPVLKPRLLTLHGHHLHMEFSHWQIKGDTAQSSLPFRRLATTWKVLYAISYFCPTLHRRGAQSSESRMSLEWLLWARGEG